MKYLLEYETRKDIFPDKIICWVPYIIMGPAPHQFDSSSEAEEYAWKLPSNTKWRISEVVEPKYILSGTTDHGIYVYRMQYHSRDNWCEYHNGGKFVYSEKSINFGVEMLKKEGWVADMPFRVLAKKYGGSFETLYVGTVKEKNTTDILMLDHSKL